MVDLVERYWDMWRALAQPAEFDVDIEEWSTSSILTVDMVDAAISGERLERVWEKTLLGLESTAYTLHVVDNVETGEYAHQPVDLNLIAESILRVRHHYLRYEPLGRTVAEIPDDQSPLEFGVREVYAPILGAALDDKQSVLKVDWMQVESQRGEAFYLPDSEIRLELDWLGRPLHFSHKNAKVTFLHEWVYGDDSHSLLPTDFYSMWAAQSSGGATHRKMRNVVIGGDIKPIFRVHSNAIYADSTNRIFRGGLQTWPEDITEKLVDVGHDSPYNVARGRESQS